MDDDDDGGGDDEDDDDGGGDGVQKPEQDPVYASHRGTTTIPHPTKHKDVYQGNYNYKVILNTS